MDKGNMTTIVKTWMLMCLPKTEILSKLIRNYSLSQQEAEHVYLSCLRELGK